jgi:hypothetical protein
MGTLLKRVEDQTDWIFTAMGMGMAQRKLINVTQANSLADLVTEFHDQSVVILLCEVHLNPGLDRLRFMKRHIFRSTLIGQMYIKLSCANSLCWIKLILTSG